MNERGSVPDRRAQPHNTLRLKRLGIANLPDVDRAMLVAHLQTSVRRMLAATSLTT